MGSYAIKVVRSKTAIVPVNASLLPRTEEERERCMRTVYVTNIDLDVQVRDTSVHAARGTADTWLHHCSLPRSAASLRRFAGRFRSCT